jgi:hypothetical protein
MEWSMRAVSSLAILVGLSSIGCGGSSHGDVTCTGTLFSDEQLCQLTCDVSTRAQVEDVLGAPGSSTSVGPDGSCEIGYLYGCSEMIGETRVPRDAWSLHLDFTQGVLTAVIAEGLGRYEGRALPSCLDPCAVTRY